MIKPALSAEVKPPETPVALYFQQEPNGKSKPHFSEISGKVTRLTIEPVEGDEEGSHWLRRFDKEGQPVWSTRHPSLKETFWYAEWEYGLKEDSWKKS